MNLHHIISDTYVAPVYRDYYGKGLAVKNASEILMNFRFETDTDFKEVEDI